MTGVAIRWAMTLTLLAHLGVVAQAVGQCTPDWASGFSLKPGGPTAVHDSVVFDDGSGEALYVCTDNGIVYKFDGAGWSSVGGKFLASLSGVAGGYVYKLHVHDPDGGGPEPASLYAAGIFRRVGSLLDGTILQAQNVARWNGTQWVPVGAGFAASAAYALETFDDGNGPRLYIGGSGAGALRRYQPDFNAWEAVNPDPGWWSETVRALKAFDDGSGPALFVGGSFTGADGIASPNIIKYTGTAWQAVADGVNGQPYSMDVFDDGSGAALFVSGGFTVPTPDMVVKWDGSSFLGTGSNIWTTFGGPFVRTLEVDGQTALYVSGNFSQVGSDTDVNGVGRFDGTQWTGVGYPHSSTTTLWTRVGAFDFDGPGPNAPQLVVMDATTPPLTRAVTDWVGFPTGTPAQLQSGARLQLLDLDGAGPQPERMFAVGRFLKYADDFSVLVHHLGEFDGFGWSAFEGGLPDLVLDGDPAGETLNACAVFDDGAGPALYVAGVFSHNDGVPANSILKWDGVAWLPLGDGIQNAGAPGTVRDMAVYDDGNGPALYVGGTFDTAGGVPAAHIAKWDGVTWSPLGSGADNWVRTLLVFDDGSGPALFVGGEFGSTPASRIAKWDGTAWSALGAGINGGVYAMLPFDDGGGTTLYATGQFTTAGGVPANRIAKWDGVAWSALGLGLANVSGVTTTVRGQCLAVFDDDGTGPSLFVGGLFSSAGGTTSRAYSVAKWNGAAWSSLDKGLRLYGESTSASVNSLAACTYAGHTALYAAGSFTMAGAANIASVNFARWSCPPPDTHPGDMNCDGDVDFDDIDPFVLALQGPGPYQAQYPDCNWLNADIDGDGNVDFDDIDPFVELLSGN